MTSKRPGLIKFAGMERTVVGDDIQLGQKAPDFLIQKNDWSLSKAFKETKRKVRIIASVPSLDTSTCDRETRRFNEEAANLGKDIVVMVVSMDLPVCTKALVWRGRCRSGDDCFRCIQGGFWKAIWYADGRGASVAPRGFCGRQEKNCTLC